MTKVVARQHLLPSVAWFLDQAIRIYGYSEICLLVKDYSAIYAVAKHLPSSVKIKPALSECLNGSSKAGLIILDDGGHLHNETPLSIARYSAGIEQTTSGLQTNWKYPSVLVCRSAAKLIFESQIISRGILRKLNSIGLLKKNVFGVIGLGALGSAIARTLLSHGIETLAYDNRVIPEDLAGLTVTLLDLLNRSDVILGCTGSDVLAGTSLNSFNGNKVFASCSSMNIEFLSVIKQLPYTEQFSSIAGWIGHMKCSVLNGGFPINFDRVREWELFDEIVLTRRLLLESISQASDLKGTKPRGVMLDPRKQKQVVLEWLERVPDRHKLKIPKALDEQFFLRNSEGEIQINEKPKYSLHSTTPGALTKMRLHKEPYDVMVMGLPILVLPNVWSPAYDWSSLFYVENMPDVKGADFLEIGCGTGVISVFAARAGANRIVATDVNPEAIRNTKFNFERFKINHAEAFLSDGFENIKGKFDLITWNAPYHGCKPADMLERSCADEGYRDIRQFFRKVHDYLKPGGRVVFGFSESGDLSLIKLLMAENGFQVKREISDWRNDYNCMLLELVESLTENP